MLKSILSPAVQYNRSRAVKILILCQVSPSHNMRLLNESIFNIQLHEMNSLPNSTYWINHLLVKCLPQVAVGHTACTTDRRNDSRFQISGGDVEPVMSLFAMTARASGHDQMILTGCFHCGRYGVLARFLNVVQER
jgi:hypothetical protein